MSGPATKRPAEGTKDAEKHLTVRPDPRGAVSIAVASIFVSFVPVSSVAVALSTIGREASVGTTELQWVTIAFSLAVAAVVLPAGVLGQRYGIRRVVLSGLLLSGAGSSLAACSALVGEDSVIRFLWAGQAVAGCGAGLLLPSTLALLATVATDGAHRARYLGWWVSGSLLGLAVGTPLTGVLLGAGSFGWIFVPTAGMSFVLASAGLRMLPRIDPVGPGRPLDLIGQVLAVGAIGSLTAGVVEIGRTGFGLLGVALVCGAVGLFSGLAFFEGRVRHPLVEVSLLRSPAVAASGFAAFVALFTGSGLLFLLGLFLQDIADLTPLEAGFVLLCVTAVPAGVNVAVVWVLARVQPLPFLAGALSVAAVGAALLAATDAQTDVWDEAWRLSVYGIGFAAALTAAPATVLAAVVSAQIQPATALVTSLRQLGGALGPAVLGSVLVSARRGGADPTEAFQLAVTTASALLGIAAGACAIATANDRR